MSNQGQEYVKKKSMNMRRLLCSKLINYIRWVELKYKCFAKSVTLQNKIHDTYTLNLLARASHEADWEGGNGQKKWVW